MSIEAAVRESLSETGTRKHPAPSGADPRHPTMLAEVLDHLRLDRVLVGIVIVYSALLLPLVPRWTENAPMLAAFTNDEPFITQQLDGMTVPPYGNPSNFLELKNANRIPGYWYQYRYYNLIYYGGTYLDLGFAVFMPLKALGAPTFPTASIVLRAFSFVAGLLSLAVLYNFGRFWISRVAGALACVAVMFDPSFVYMASMVHPDMLQLFLTMLALVIGVRHARIGDWPSLLMLGVIIGLIQGTKSGAPYVLPMAALAVAVDAWRRVGRGTFQGLVGWVARGSARFAAMGTIALLAFIASTPYILFDPYYIRTTRAQYLVLTGTSPLIPISFSDWYGAIVAELGWPLVAAIAVGCGWFLVGGIRSRRWQAPPALALALGLGNLVWFTTVARLWVALYYILAALALLTLFAGRLLDRARGALRIGGRPGVWAGRVLVVVVLATVAFSNDRPAAIAFTVAQGLAVTRTPQMMLAAWAEGALPPNSRLLFDDEAYFDPRRFPTQATNAGVIRYLDVYQKRPDYIVLTDYPSSANWIMVKRQTQRFDTWTDDPYSVRLYQDLIDRNPTPYTPGPTPNQYFRLEQAVGIPWVDVKTEPRSFRAFDLFYRSLNPGYAGLQGALSAGHRLLIYHVDPAYFDQTLPGHSAVDFKPISSPTATGYAAVDAFDGASTVWMADGVGPGLDGAYVGLDYGAGRAQPVSSVTVKWVADHWLPRRIALQYSDDGAAWSDAIVRDEVAPPDSVGAPGTKRWAESISVPPSGQHRFWRLVALDVAPNDYFGVEDLVFSP